MREIVLESDESVNETNETQARIEYEDKGSLLTDYLDRKLEVVWQELLKESKPGSLFDRQNLNYLRVEDAYDANKLTDENGHYSIVCGPTYFRHYASKVAVLNGQKDPLKYGLTEDDLVALENLRPLSSFPTITVSDDSLYVIMGKKGWNTLDGGAGKLSFVGAGYMDLERDRTDKGGPMKEIDEIILREVYEETSIKASEVGDISILGIAEDRFKGGHWQPAVFSLLKSSLTREEVKRRKGVAEDAWEFRGPYVFVPVEESVFEALIDSDKSHGNEPMGNDIAERIDGLGNKRTIDTTGKAGAMLFMLGRSYFGDHWFHDQLEKHKEHVRFTYT